MTRRLFTAVAFTLTTASTLPADFSYQQTSTITGGAVASLMKVAGAFSKSAREPNRSAISVKGDRMLHRSGDSASIVDVGAETITNIDFKKKTYSVMTFEEMKQALEAMAAKMKDNKSGSEVAFKVSADNTGKTQQIDGADAKEIILKMEMESTDPKQAGSMTITTDMWMAPGVEGYEEVRNLQLRLAEKLNWTPGSNAFMTQPEIARGMADAMKEMSKIDGVPVLQFVTMGAAGQEGASGSAPPAQPEPAPAARPGIGGALGRLGGIGGFGRKKSEPKPEETGDRQSGAPGTLLEMKTELTGFSTAPVDEAQFDVPVGFKQVESGLKK